MQRSSTQRSIKRLASLPTASGGLSRLAANRLRRANIKLEPLLSRVALTIEQINDPEQRIDARRQIAFLETAAKSLNDVFLGLDLAEEFDCRDLGLLYYVMASSDTLGDALKAAAQGLSAVVTATAAAQLTRMNTTADKMNSFRIIPPVLKGRSNRPSSCVRLYERN
jgi:hypothetical protein